MKLKQIFLLIVITLFSCFLCFSLFAQMPTAGLVAYWPMDGNYNDAGPNAIHGTNNGSTATTNKAGVAGKAMNFLNPASPVPQFATHPITAALNFSGTQNFTISLLVYANSPYVHTGGLYDNGVNSGGPAVWFWTSNGFPEIRFNYKNGSIGTPNGAFSLGVWQNVTCVRENGILKTYVNGLLKVSGNEGTTAPTFPLPARFGTMYATSFNPPQYNGHNGKLDEVRIYNRALTVAEIGGIASITLPLKLGDFTGVKNSAGINLNWETITEQNTSHFEIERSSNGTDYMSIGTLNAAGNSADRRTYSFPDNSPLPGTNFYRLKMVDIDRTFTYSRVIAVKNDNSTLMLELFPNPAKDVLQVQVPSLKKQMIRLFISDASGKIVYERNLPVNEGNNAISIPVLTLPQGIYLLTSATPDNRQSALFIRQE